MKTEIIAITDRSGSMGTIASEVIGGYNKFLDDQKSQPGEARMTYVQFDDVVDTVYQGIDIKTAHNLDSYRYVPRGMTALYDAIGKVFEAQGKRIHDEKWADLVIVAIITDGAENASRQYSHAQVTGMIKHAEANGWKVLFLAANMDAKAVAQNLGSTGQYAGNFAATAQGATAAYGTMSATASSMRSGFDPATLLVKNP